MFDLLPSKDTPDQIDRASGGLRSKDRGAAPAAGAVDPVWRRVVSTVLRPGDLVLVLANGLISERWTHQLRDLGLRVELLQAAFGEDVPARALASRLGRDLNDDVRAVFVREVEPSTGVASGLAAVRRAMDESFHEALLIVDATGPGSSLVVDMEPHGADVVVTERDGTIAVIGPEQPSWSGGLVCHARPSEQSRSLVSREGLIANHDRVVAALRSALAAMELRFLLRYPRLAARGITVVRLGETLDGQMIARTVNGSDGVRLESFHDLVCGQIMCLFHPVGMTAEGCVAVVERLEQELIKAGAGVWPGAGMRAVRRHLGMMDAVYHDRLDFAAE